MHILLISLVLAQALDSSAEDIESTTTTTEDAYIESAEDIDPVQEMLALAELLQERLPDAAEAAMAPEVAPVPIYVDVGPMPDTTVDSGLPAPETTTTTTTTPIE